MRTLLSLAVVGAVIAVTSGTAAAQYSDQTRRYNQQYSESLRKGAPPPVAEVTTVTQQVAVIHVEDQFPEQGADNPSGLLSNEDWNSENSSGGAETAIRPGFPFTMGNNPMELDPQEAGPTYRRGGSTVIITK